ncbi:MAG: hypothetical protein ACYC4U_31905 [Pirellulaceae bacterium]
MDFGYDPQEARAGCFGLKRRGKRSRRLPGHDDVKGGPSHTPRAAVRRPAERQPSLAWNFDPRTPTCDYFERQNLDYAEDLQDAVENFISGMERGEFLAWEAVVAHEQGLPLTSPQQAALDELIDLSDSDSDRFLYINGLPRTAEPWYVILNMLVPRLLAEPFRTLDPRAREHHGRWRRLVECLHEHAFCLSLPNGVTSAVDVIPAPLQHRLWLHDCFEFLSAPRGDKQLTHESESQQERIEDFIESLRERRDTVRYFNLTLESLLTRLILPQAERPHFLRVMQEKLGMMSPSGRIADHL